MDLCESLDATLKNGQLTRSEGEKLRVRLLFASGQLFGRLIRNQIRLLSLSFKEGIVCCQVAPLKPCKVYEIKSAPTPRERLLVP